MKLKQHPDDFFVEELADVRAGSEGEFALYRLEKRGWTTPDAVLAIRRRWRLDARRISFGGLKDRHAHTIQYLTIRHGPERRFSQQDIHLEYLGRIAGPFVSRNIQGNRFRLVLRDLSEEDAKVARDALAEVREDGVPNYFDDQRFGSVHGREFMARALVEGDFERALRLALTAAYDHDRAAQKREKAILRHHWGDWAACQAQLRRGPTRNIVEYLARHPGDMRGAVLRLRPELRGLYLSAYQSHLWNRMLARWLREHLPPEQLLEVHLRLGAMPMQRRLSASQRAELAALQLPLPTARGEADPADSRTALMQAVLAEEGLTREQLKVKGVRELFFSRGERAALCLPEHLQEQSADDEENHKRRKLLLEFVLPRGCYATLLVKRITARPAASGASGP
jgi:tRNA pseudouridine13 synthase